jgi:denticleless
MLQIVTCSEDTHHQIWRVGFDFQDSGAMLAGWTETVDITHAREGITKQVAERTPHADKICISRQEGTLDFVCSDVMVLDSHCCNCISKGQATTPCATCLNVRSRKFPMPKRKLEDLQDASASCSYGSCSKDAVLLPIREGNEESRVWLETKEVRRLFSPCKNSVTEQSSPSSQQLSRETGSDAILSSPTLNLPNYVLDGTSPHHRCSPSGRLKENVNWLTKLRKEKTNCGAKQTSPNTYVTPKRRLTRSRSHECNKRTNPERNSETLWRFFHVAGKQMERH